MAGEVLLGYDGLEGSKAALPLATRFAAAFGRGLVIVFGYAPAAIGGEVADLAKAVEDLGARITKEAVAMVHDVDPSVTASVELVNDRPVDALLRAADAYDALAIVVGAGNRGPVTGSLLGSVSYHVVHRSTRPVIVVPTPQT